MQEVEFRFSLPFSSGFRVAVHVPGSHHDCSPGLRCDDVQKGHSCDTKVTWRLCGWEGARLGCEEQRLQWLLLLAALLPAHLLSALSNAAVVLERMQWNDLQLHQHLSGMVSSQGKARKCPVNTLLATAGKAPSSLFHRPAGAVGSNAATFWAVILSLLLL